MFMPSYAQSLFERASACKHVCVWVRVCMCVCMCVRCISLLCFLVLFVAEMSQPVPCPFQNAFEFYYNNNSGGLCRTPLSHAHQCATNKRFHFRFNRCPDLAYTFDKGIQSHYSD